jgi:hypothetical protein
MGDHLKARVGTGVSCLIAFALGCMTASSHEQIKIHCGEALQIGSDSATRKDWGGTSTWEAVAHEDTLILSRTGQCGDECNYEEKIVFTSLAAKCPTLVVATVAKTDRGSPATAPRVNAATRGTLHIQDWKPAGGIVSGKLDAEIKLTFYVQTAAPESAPQK